VGTLFSFWKAGAKKLHTLLQLLLKLGCLVVSLVLLVVGAW
jgi:hypothetical protein|tara:strand:+ start:568 stop:690 length:123 start_codon:yes stop_codon:yes gene_type:complete